MIRKYVLSEISLEEILNRDIRQEKDVDAIVEAILEDVRQNGDEALRRYAAKLDHAQIGALNWVMEVPAALVQGFWATL